MKYAKYPDESYDICFNLIDQTNYYLDILQDAELSLCGTSCVISAIRDAS